MIDFQLGKLKLKYSLRAVEVLIIDEIYCLSPYNSKLSLCVIGIRPGVHFFFWNMYFFMDKFTAIMEKSYDNGVEAMAVQDREIQCTDGKQDSPGFKF